MTGPCWIRRMMRVVRIMVRRIAPVIIIIIMIVVVVLVRIYISLIDDGGWTYLVCRTLDLLSPGR